MDRVRFRGTLRRIANLRGMETFLFERSVLLKNFKAWATGLTAGLKNSIERLAEENEMPIHYVSNSSVRKEDVAKDLPEKIEVRAWCGLTPEQATSIAGCSKGRLTSLGLWSGANRCRRR